MKLKKTILSVMACVLSFVMLLSLAACGPKEPEVTALTLSAATVEIATGESSRLTVTAKYSDETTAELEAKDVEWSSSAESVATVSRGVVSAKSKGTATVTAKVGEVTATCAVTVYSLTVEISETEATVEKGQTKTLTATVKKDGTALQGEKFDWSSSDDTIATVDDNGVVTAYMAGEATVTATRKGGKQSAECKVTVTWTNKPASYAAIGNTEQNKAKPNTWGFWNDQGWNWTTSTVYEAYAEDYETGKTPAAGYEYIGAQKANIQFKMDNPGVHDAAIQLIYRSAGESGKLETNHNYTVSLKLNSNVAGKVVLNAYGDVAPKREKGENESDEDYAAYVKEYEEGLKQFEHKFDIQAGENTLTATFRHGDFGSIYKNGVYDNVESAIHLLLGNLEGRVSVSVYDVQFKDEGPATNLVEEDSSKLEGTEGPAEIPDLSEVNNIALGLESEETDKGNYAVTTQDEGKTYNVVYTDTAGESYHNLVVDLTETNAAECNTFAVTVTNNAEAAMRIRFDINGETAHGTNNVLDIVQSAVATEGTPVTNLEWGGTDIEIAAGDTVTLYLTYDAATESGAPQQLLIYFHTHVYQDGGNTHSGNVTLSDFKFATVEKSAPKLPDFGDIQFETDLTGKDKYVTLTEEGGKAVYTVHQKLTFTGKTDEQIIAELTAIDDTAHTNGLFYNTELSALTKAGVEAALAKMHIDFEGNGFALGGQWGAAGSVTFLSADATVTKDGENVTITFDAKYDVTATSKGAYTNHFGYGWGDNAGNPEMKGIDFKPGFAYKSEAITLGGKTYLVVVVPDNTDGTFFWGCAGLFVLA